MSIFCVNTNAGGIYKYIQHDEVLNARHIQDLIMAERILKGANNSKGSPSILEEENGVSGEVALTLY